MLKMMCPNCHELIVSSLLAEIDETFCSHCNEGVPVRNVLISARGMTINRDDLLKRFFRYKKLLHEVVEERALMEDSRESLETSKKSSDHFIATLEELMAGARDNFRLQFSLTVPVRFNYDGHVQSGWLVNLSMVGACIEIDNVYVLPSIGSGVSIDFSLPGQKSGFSVSGMVAWIKPAGRELDSVFDVGIRFTDIVEKDRVDLWQLISSSVRDVMGESRH